MSETRHDNEFTDYTVSTVEAAKDGGWFMGLGDGGGFFCPPNSQIEPKAGMTARLYGKGFGYIVRGLFLDGAKVFYRTESQQQTQNMIELEEARKSRQINLDQSRDERGRRWNALPEPFQLRAAGFAERNPNWRRDQEPYELFVCEQAHLIARTLKTVDVIREWRKGTFDEMAAVVPIDDGHSGNTLGCAVHLACIYLEHPVMVPMEHGAGCPIVGCREYGCYAARTPRRD